MQLFSAEAIVFSKKKFFWPRKCEKNWPQKLLMIDPDPFISQSSQDQRPKAQNWFFILRNLGTRHLFSYLWLFPIISIVPLLQGSKAVHIHGNKVFTCNQTVDGLVSTTVRHWYPFPQETIKADKRLANPLFSVRGSFLMQSGKYFRNLAYSMLFILSIAVVVASELSFIL